MFKQLRKKLLFLWVRFRTSESVVAFYARKADSYHDRQRRNHNRWERFNFRLIHGMSLDMTNPQTFNEKICCKKLFDRNPLLTVIADKHLARDYVRDKLGSEAEDILIPQLYVTDKLEDIPFDKFDGDYILKANHGSRMNIIVRKGDDIDVNLIRAKLRLWLVKDFGVTRNEWCYQDIPRLIVVERLLDDGKGQVPTDVKFHVFAGKVKVTQLFFGRFSKGGKKQVLLDHKLNRMFRDDNTVQAEEYEIPSNLNHMISIAEILGSGLEYVRVDLYSVGDQIYFGELTNYHASGRKRLRPRELDYQIGAYWSERQTYLPDLYNVAI